MDEQRKQELLARFKNAPSGLKKRIVLQEPLWEKQPGESLRQWEAFVRFRDMETSERSIVGVAKLMKRHPQVIQRYATTNKWHVRVEAYELYNDRIRLQVFEKSKRERAEIQMQLAQGMAMLGGHHIQTKLELVETAKQNPEVVVEISDKDAVHMIDAGIKWMRTLDGQATQHILIETPQMAQERMLREAVADVTELYRLDPRIALEQRIAWAAEDYQLDPNELTSAVHGYIDETENVEM